MTKKSKITALQTAFSFGVTINLPNHQSLVPPKEHVGTAVILDF